MARGSPPQISLLLQRRGQQFAAAVREAERQSAQEALQWARTLSSGSLSRRQLRALGHPYAVRAPRPPGDPAIINLQSGRFLASWRVSGPRRTAGGLSTRLVNTAPWARFLSSGTGRMIARPILARIRQRLAASRRRRHLQAVRQALRS